MKKTGPKNRGSHPSGLPLVMSGLYISCAYPPKDSLKSTTRSSGFSVVKKSVIRREHMAERDLLFHDTLAPHLAAYALKASAAQQRAFLAHLHATLNAPSHPIRHRLLRLTADSPDLLAVIKQEGRV